MITALVLAAGEARRFGGPKQLAPLHGRPLLAHAVATARDAGLDRVVVVLGARAEAVRAEVDLAGVEVAVCENWAEGMSASLRCGLEAAAGSDEVVVLLGDQPGVGAGAIARVLLQYVQASVAARARVEAFAFGTQITRLTPELAGRDPDRALARAADRVADWSGGTRIGASLATLNREHGGRVGRGAFVVLLSDGWDRGDPAELAAELARLRRTAHRLVWLNPLAADPRYAPLTRGMRAAMPFVDRLLPGNSIASLDQLADLMESAQ